MEAFYGQTGRKKYNQCKSKVNLSRYLHAGDKGERKYRSYSFSTSALHGGEWSASRPGRGLSPATFVTWMNDVCGNRTLGGVQDSVKGLGVWVD
jgi:hypothetical protein